MRIVLGDDYIDRVFQHFPKVKDSVDFCAYWFRLAHDHLGENGRAGLVGTNSISQGKSRVATLDYITQNDKPYVAQRRAHSRAPLPKI